MSDKLAAIIELHQPGNKNSEIVKLLKTPNSTIYRTDCIFKELQGTENLP